MNLRREAAFLAGACAEVCWFTPWFIALTPVTVGLPDAVAIAWVAGLILAPLALTRLLHALHLKLRLRRWVHALALVLAGGVALRGLVYVEEPLPPLELLRRPLASFTQPLNLLPHELLILLVVLLLWWRGLRLGQAAPSVALAGLRFRAGVVIFVVFLFFFNLYLIRDITPYIVAFFFFSLMAVAMARVEEVSRLRGGQAMPLGRAWLGILALASAAVIGVGAAVTGLLAGPLPGQVLSWLSPVWLILIALIALILSLFVAALAVLVEFVASVIPNIDLRFMAQLEERLQTIRQSISQMGASFSPEVMHVVGVLQGLAFMVILALVLVGVLRAVRRLQSAPSQRGQGTETLLTGGLLASAWRGLLDESAGGLARLVQRFGLGRRMLAALSIRRIYAQMARLAATRGYPRAPSETPYQYLSSLARAFPNATDQVRLITKAYVNVHYGELPETPEDLATIRAAWAELRASQPQPAADG